MPSANETIQELANQEYKYGFVTDIEADAIPRGLNEEVVRTISARKNEPDFLLEWRLRAYRHWLTMTEPAWHNVHYPPIDYQDIIYYAAPKSGKDGPKSLDEVDPELLQTYEKLGISLQEQERLSGVAVDAVFDSVSGGHHLPREAGGVGNHLLLLLGSRSEPPGAGEAVSGVGGSLYRQLLCHAQLGGLQRRVVLLHPQGRSLSHGALHLLPHQRQGHRAVPSAR